MNVDREPRLRGSSLEAIEHILLLLLSPATEQEKWAKGEGVPAEEIAFTYYDLVDIWLPGLQEAALIDDLDRECLQDLKRLLESTQVQLFSGVGVASSAREWQTVRARAAEVLQTLRRHSLI